MALDDDLYRLVPCGEENAVTSRLIWRQLGLWSPATVKGRLNVLAAEGRLERKMVRVAGGEVAKYFRPLA